MWIGWNSNLLDVCKLQESNQVIHCRVRLVDSNQCFFVSVVYAMNDALHRRDLWTSLCSFSRVVNDGPWCVLGDFNVVRSRDENDGGAGPHIPIW